MRELDHCINCGYALADYGDAHDDGLRDCPPAFGTQAARYDDSDTLGGQLRRLETEAKAAGAHGILAGIDQVRARHREAVFDAVADIREAR